MATPAARTASSVHVPPVLGKWKKIILSVRKVAISFACVLSKRLPPPNAGRRRSSSRDHTTCSTRNPTFPLRAQRSSVQGDVHNGTKRSMSAPWEIAFRRHATAAIMQLSLFGRGDVRLIRAADWDYIPVSHPAPQPPSTSPIRRHRREPLRQLIFVDSSFLGRARQPPRHPTRASQGASGSPRQGSARHHQTKCAGRPGRSCDAEPDTRWPSDSRRRSSLATRGGSASLRDRRDRHRAMIAPPRRPRVLMGPCHKLRHNAPVAHHRGLHLGRPLRRRRVTSCASENRFARRCRLTWGSDVELYAPHA